MPDVGSSRAETVLRSDATDSDMQRMVGKQQVDATGQAFELFAALLKRRPSPRKSAWSLTFLRTHGGRGKHQKGGDDRQGSHWISSTDFFRRELLAPALWMKQLGDLADVFRSLAFSFEISSISTADALPLWKAGAFGVLHVTKLGLDEIGHRTLRISSRGRRLRDVDST